MGRCAVAVALCHAAGSLIGAPASYGIIEVGSPRSRRDGLFKSTFLPARRISLKGGGRSELVQDENKKREVLHAEGRTTPENPYSSDRTALQDFQSNENDGQDHSNSDSSHGGGWGAVGSGFTNAQDLLGIKKKRVGEASNALRRKKIRPFDDSAVKVSEEFSHRKEPMELKA